MANRDVVGLKTVGKTWTGKSEVVSVIYDFDLDAGATADDLMLLTFEDNSMVKLLGVKCLTAPTSGGSATFNCGLDGVGSENQFLNAVAYNSFVEGAWVVGASGPYQSITASSEVLLRIATAAITAGKLEFYFEVMN